MASVTPRIKANGEVTWRVQFRVNGRMSQQSFADEKAAVKFGLLVDRIGGDAALRARSARNASTSPTLAEFTERYLDPTSGMLSGVTPGTRAGYRQIAERSFLKILGPYPVDAITKQDVAAWVTWQEDQPSTRYRDRKMSAKTMRNYHGLLSAIFAAAVDVKLVDANPARGTALSKGRRTGVTFLTQTEFETVMEFIPEHYRPLTLMLAGTGMRWGEATALTWSDIDTSHNPPMLRIEKAWQKGVANKPVLGPPKTEKGNRTISLWPELIAALGDRKAGSDLIFRGEISGNRLWSERFHKAAWVPAVNAANDEARCAAVGRVPIGKRPRVHDLRHTHASWLIADGVPLPYIQHRLGHENITTTVDLYGHLLPDMQYATAKVAAEVMRNVLPQLTPMPVIEA